jgi:hypothetical protein
VGAIFLCAGWIVFFFFFFCACAKEPRYFPDRGIDRSTDYFGMSEIMKMNSGHCYMKR